MNVKVGQRYTSNDGYYLSAGTFTVTVIHICNAEWTEHVHYLITNVAKSSDDMYVGKVYYIPMGHFLERFGPCLDNLS